MAPRGTRPRKRAEAGGWKTEIDAGITRTQRRSPGARSFLRRARRLWLRLLASDNDQERVPRVRGFGDALVSAAVCVQLLHLSASGLEFRSHARAQMACCCSDVSGRLFF